MKSKIISALIAVAVALGVWLYVVTVISPNSDKSFHNIEVNMEGEALLNDQGLMVTNPEISTATLHLEGSRVDLNKLNSENIILNVDVSKISAPGTHDLPYSIDFKDMSANAFTVLDKKPGTVKVIVEERISKIVPVQPMYNGTVAENYMADTENAVLDVSTVTVTGPKPVVDMIAMARIDVDLEGRKESLNEKFEYALCSADGTPMDVQSVITDVEEIKLTLRVTRVKKITLEVTVIDGGGATKDVNVTPIDPPTIDVSGSDAQLEKLEVWNVGTIDLSQITEEGELTFAIDLPEGVVNETGITEAKVNVSFSDLETKTLTVTNIRAINVPAGLSVELVAKALTIQIRGPKDKIDALTAENITVTVDCATATKGNVKLKATIDCGDPQIGAINADGPYMVSVTVSEATTG